MKADEAPVEIGARIKAARVKTGLSAAELSRLLGITTGGMSLIESGSRQPSKELVFRISELVRATTAELFGADPGTLYGVGPPPPGVFEGQPESDWPSFLRGSPPEYWPGTLRSFIASAAADMVQLIPAEVPLLAKMGLFGGAPTDEAGWIRQLTMLRLLIGAGGRPVLLEMVEREGGEDRG